MLNPVQEKLLAMLQWFDSYCQKHDICYYVAGGTMLGAIRHGGFIPWDDDVDVVIPRTDYEKLIHSFDPEGSKYELESPYSGTDDYLFSFAKLYDTETTLTENVGSGFTRGLYIDLFPIDGVGGEDWLLNFKKYNRFRSLLLTRTCAVRKGRSFLKNFVIIMVKWIPGFILNNKKLSIKVDRAAARLDYGSSDYVGNLMGAYGKKEILRKEIFGRPTRYAFENIEVNGPERYNEYLTTIYGDWNQIPPENKRHGKHSYLLLDLEHSYKDQTR